MSKVKSIDTATKEGRNLIVDFLNSHGVNATVFGLESNSYAREIRFSVYGIDYIIIWFVNQSTLYIGEGERAASIPFKHIYLDECFPIAGGNKSIGFAYVKNEKHSMFDREFPYEVFRIPLEIK